MYDENCFKNFLTQRILKNSNNDKNNSNKKKMLF